MPNSKNSIADKYFEMRSTSRLLYDAHTHLPEHKYQELQPNGLAAQDSSDLGYAIINGTSPVDWSTVLEFTQRYFQALPAIGLHPQNVADASVDWKGTFLQFLTDNPTCSIGEIGLDRRYKGDCFEKQLEAFSWQLKQASDQNRPVSIHCVKAIGILMETLRTHNLPPRGIHLHAYAGSVELIPELVEMGACFSFAARQLVSNNTKVRDRIRAVPMNRLLVETDKTYQNDSSELRNCYVAIAAIRGISLAQMVTCIEENFKFYFLNR